MISLNNPKEKKLREWNSKKTLIGKIVFCFMKFNNLNLDNIIIIYPMIISLIH
jgi:hypothetical protein